MSWKKIALVVAALLAVALAMHFGRGSGGNGDKADKAARAPAAVPVEVASASRGDVELSLKLVGRVEAWSTVSLRARVSGQLESLSFTPGALVRKGSVLAQVDPRLLQAQLDQARGSVARDQALLQKAQADQRRYADMLARGFVSKADYDLYQANLAVARATLQSDRAAQELAQTQLDYASIRAPFDGIAGAPLVWPGAQISADSTGLVVLNQVEPVRVAFNIPEDSLPAVRDAQKHGALAVQVVVAGDQAAPLAGTLEFIDNAVDASTGTIVLKARFDNAEHRLTPGQFVQVTLPTTRLMDVVSVPVQALQSSSGGSFVFVLGADGKVRQRYVTPGPTSAGRTVIDKGLKAGEQVVTEGQMLLVDGSTVTVRR
ncbi:efflux RND transporter periplasmic adaptor subunit [Rhodanobacter denitrificans]|uniref:efflux RND transporter periplasmic adaptor subunit n=1 Tax=Rhodanobacter denitrificans TaxID=666685 RepID=UPI00026106AF|nr:efflux RND transporter periplasmic adaptor subunit [Rhodanobacter denitrificans]EIM03597.1 secretion protein HlyD [Rhodanobacter denitrificans]UJM91186.1 efflux RND transporter periplasmic adaptor subunit [Rhodanobacter denitrificans]